MSAHHEENFSSLPEEAVVLIFPEMPDVFIKRAERLHFLAKGNATREYIGAMAHLAEAQVSACRIFPSKKEKLSITPLSFDPSHYSYGDDLQKTLDVILLGMQSVRLPGNLKDGLLHLKSMPSAGLEFMARALLCRNYDSIDLAASPILSAAVQVYWTALASGIHIDAAQQITNFCPVCSSPPVAGIIDDHGSKYLCCSLCSTHWHIPRSMCANCRATGTLFHFSVESEPNIGRVETCGQCNTYLKIFNRQSDSEVEAQADDLASISLDLLMSEEPYSKSGVNLFLLRR